MLRFLNIRVQNWIVYEDVEFSVCNDPDKNLTVIRAENGVGKTVLMRAIRWALYGDEILTSFDEKDSPFMVCPVWEDEGSFESVVEIDFETDLVTRDAANPDQTRLETYRLIRSLMTTGSKDDGLTRGASRLLLYKRDPTGGESVKEPNPEDLISKLLPPSLSDLFVMDADQAAEYTGGVEGHKVDITHASERATKAISTLLGLELVENAMTRMDALQREFRRDATLAIDDDEITQMEAQLSSFIDQIKETEKELKEETEKRSDLKAQEKATREQLNRELKESGSYEQLENRKTDNETLLGVLRKDRGRLRINLSNLFEDTNLLAALCKTDIEKVSEELLPLYEEGAIPQQHLSFVKKLIQKGTCVCGQDLHEPSPHRTSVEESIEQAQGNASGADFLGNAWEVANGLEERLSDGLGKWVEEKEDYSQDLEVVAGKLREQSDERKKINDLLGNIEEDKIKQLLNKLGVLETQLENSTVRMGRHEESLAQLKPRKENLDHILAQRARNRREADDHTKRELVAKITHDLLQHAYGRVRDEQVVAVSQLMDKILHQIVHDESWGEIEGSKEEGTLGLQNIRQVGVRPVSDKEDKYELYALNRRGDNMSMQQINGASRRVVALAFVLALCEESKTRAPIVGDSLLNSMSGTVSESTVVLAAKHASQAILLLTPKDLADGLGEQLSDDPESPMGASYTITNMDQVGTRKGKVVRKQDGKGGRTLLCECSPVQYCEICERHGKSDTWTSRG